ncbi:unnamed protein product [Durusdinium trenchii]|uniref:Ion transport domain-containing protein n=1 Tax=Durusdinium trenchii TaxID=1381693 RepID=A0ABP0P8R7_9DINO
MLSVFLPLVRFMKLLRYFEVFRLLMVAFQNSVPALPVLSYFMAVLVLFSATGLYLAEERSNIPSMSQSIWLAVVTMTTVGYGDFVPKTLGGYVVVFALTLLSVWFLALPVGIIGYEFTASWKRRGEVLVMTRTRKCLEKWGYTSAGLSLLFSYVDVDSDGTLSISERSPSDLLSRTYTRLFLALQKCLTIQIHYVGRGARMGLVTTDWRAQDWC